MSERWAVLVTGATSWSDVSTMYVALSNMPPGTVVIHGQAKGAEELADEMAKQLCFPVIRVPFVGWMRGTGPSRVSRNQLMADLLAGLREQGYNTRVLAFGGDAGTDDMVSRTQTRFDVVRFVAPVAAGGRS